MKLPLDVPYHVCVNEKEGKVYCLYLVDVPRGIKRKERTQEQEVIILGVPYKHFLTRLWPVWKNHLKERKEFI